MLATRSARFAAIGTWKARCVFTALATSCGPGPVAERLHVGRVAVLVTTPTLFRRTVAPMLNRLPELRLVLICGASEDQSARTALGNGAEVMSCGAFLRESTHDFAGEATDPDAPATLHFTSATSGRPTALVRSHRVATIQNRTAHLVFDLHRGDMYWCAVDPGWMTGIADSLRAPR